MINPDGIPQISSSSISQVAADASALLSGAAQLSASGVSLSSAWQGLPGGFSTPDTPALVDAVLPMRTTTDRLGEDLLTIGRALQVYADAVAPIADQLSQLKVQAMDFVSSVTGVDDWQRDGDRVDRHNGLLSGVGAAVAAWNDAERACANAITALYFGAQYVQDNCDGAQDANEYGYSADALGQAAGDASSGLSWGSNENETYGFWGTVGQVFVGAADGVWSGIKGLGALTGLEGGDAFKNAWTGIGNLTGLNGWDKFTSGWTAVGKGLTDWDEWAKNPGKAFGEVMSNFINAPTFAVKAGKFAVKAGQVGAKVARDSKWVSNTGKWVADGAKAGEKWLANQPTFPELLGNARQMLGTSERPALAGVPNDVDSGVFRVDSKRRSKAASSETPSAPPPPGSTTHYDKTGKMIGDGGAVHTSDTPQEDWGEGYRIDTENPAPGQRPGQLHLQLSSDGR